MYLKRFFPLFYMLGSVLVLAGAFAYLPFREIAPYVYLPGAVLVGLVQFFSPYKGKDPVIKRLYRQRLFGASFLILAGILMITLPRGNEWILCLTLAAVIQLYTAYRIPILEKRNQSQ